MYHTRTDVIQPIASTPEPLMARDRFARRLALLWLVVAMLFQGLVTQTHVHISADPSSVVIAATTNAAPTVGVQKDGPVVPVCLLCEEQALFGAYLLGGSAAIAMNDAAYRLGSITLAANGSGGAAGGSGTGGSASFVNSGTAGGAGDRIVGLLQLEASGGDFAGRTAISDTATGTATIGSVTAYSDGAAASGAAGFFYASSDTPRLVNGSMTVRTGGSADFQIASGGTLSVSGALTVDAAGNITIAHAAPAGAVSIQAGTATFNAGNGFTSSAGTIVNGGEQLRITAGAGGIAAANLRASDLISARTLGSITLRDATVNGPV